MKEIWRDVKGYEGFLPFKRLQEKLVSRMEVFVGRVKGNFYQLAVSFGIIDKYLYSSNF